MSLPTTEPRHLTAGDTWSWEITLADYPASAGWALSYALVSATAKIALTSSASGDAHLVSVSATTSAGYAAGDYAWQSYVTKSGQRYTVASGTVTVQPNFATQSTGYDARSDAAKALAAIESYLATGDLSIAEVTFEGRTLRRIPLPDLYAIRDRLRNEVASEAAAARAATLGLDPRRYAIRLGVD